MACRKEYQRCHERDCLKDVKDSVPSLVAHAQEIPGMAIVKWMTSLANAANGVA